VLAQHIRFNSHLVTEANKEVVGQADSRLLGAGATGIDQRPRGVEAPPPGPPSIIDRERSRRQWRKRDRSAPRQVLGEQARSGDGTGGKRQAPSFDTVFSDVDLHRQRFEDRGPTWSGEAELTWATVICGRRTPLSRRVRPLNPCPCSRWHDVLTLSYAGGIEIQVGPEPLEESLPQLVLPLRLIGPEVQLKAQEFRSGSSLRCSTGGILHGNGVARSPANGLQRRCVLAEAGH
jgi:hypothetical protein